MSDQTSDIYEIMQTQRAIRRWTDAPVDREVIERIIQTACWAPSGSNSQPWGFVVVTDDGKRRRLADAMREGFQNRIGASFPNPDEMEDPIRRRMYRGAKALFEDFAAAPVWTIPCLLMDSVAQAGQPAGREQHLPQYPEPNLILAARAEGLGTVLTTPQDMVMDQLRTELDIPNHALPVAMIPMGHPDANFGPVARSP